MSIRETLIFDFEKPDFYSHSNMWWLLKWDKYSILHPIPELKRMTKIHLQTWVK